MSIDVLQEKIRVLKNPTMVGLDPTPEVVPGYLLEEARRELGQTRMRYNPRIMMNPVTPVSWVFFGAYALLCLLPVGLEVWTEYRFHRARRMLL